MSRTASGEGIVIYLQEELGDARLRCNQLKDYINEAVELIEKSDKRDHFFEVAGHLLHGIPDTLMRVEKALASAAMAVSKWDYESVKEDLRPEKAEQLEDALKEVRTRRVERRSSNPESKVTMKTHEAALELQKIARSIETTGKVDSAAVIALIASLEAGGACHTASSKGDVAKALRELSKTLKEGGVDRPSRAVLATALRRVLAETLEVAVATPPPLPGPGFAPYSLVDGFDNIRASAISAFRRGERQPRLAFVDLSAIVQEIGLMCESLGSANVPELAARMSKAVIQSRLLLTPEVVQSMAMSASDKTAANLAVTAMLRAFAEGSKFGGFEVNDVRGAADRLEAAAMKTAKLAFQYHLDAPPTSLFTEVAGRVHDLAFYMGSAVAEPAAAAQAQPQMRAMASEKTAGLPTVTQMVNAFREGVEFGDYEMRDVRGAAQRVGAAAQAAAKYAQQPNALSTKMPIHVFTELAERLYDLGFYIGSASAALARTASEEKESRFEEGKPADPTENMSEQDAETWKTEHAKNKDNFKAAADQTDDEGKQAWTKAKSLVPKVNKNKKYAEDDKRSRFEEGKPADPTEAMDEDAAAEWEQNTEEYGDKFKEAAYDLWKA